MNPYNVQPGQVWQSTDPRDGGRLVYVISVDEEEGYAATSRFPNHYFPHTIRLDRFRPNSTGYRLLHP